MKDEYDFSGYATKNDIVCSDGRTILKDAFKHNDGARVPLVWQHGHNDPANVLGYGVLENRPDGVYVYGKFNGTTAGANAKELVQHGDINALSIFANKLVEKSKKVHSGSIREVSLVLSGANPGALIDNLVMAHADGTTSDALDEAIIYSGLSLEEKQMAQAATSTDNSEETVGDVFDTLNEKQKTVVYAMIAEAIDTNGGDMAQSESEEEGDNFMKQNVFDQTTSDRKGPTLSHSQIKEIFEDAQKTGSLKESFLAHAVTYGIENIDYLFPDAKALTNAPDFVKRDMGWVNVWMNGTRHNPFSRIKSLSADITLDTARALGYVKGAMKKEEFFALSKRVTTPTTIYKKQKLDRDDMIDITDLDVVAFLKAEMRMLLDEEIARAGLVGDGRDVASEDKINESNIRPIYKDAELYVHRVELASDATVLETMESIVRARKNYKGVGNPVMFTTTDTLTDMLLYKDTLNRRMYNTTADLEAALRVSKIVEVPILEGVSRVVDATVDYTVDLVAILVNPNDYVYGADKGGNISLFDDFDIDYNQYKYLMETRLSGALVSPKTAIVVEKIAAGG